MATTPIALLCTSRSWGGLEMNVARLASWLTPLGYQPHVVGHPTGPLAQAIHRQAGRYIPLNRRLKYFDYPAAWALARALVRARVPLLVVTTTRDLHTAALAKRWFYPTLKLVYWQQMQLGVNKKGPVHRFIFSQLTSWIAPMPWLRDQVGQRTSFPQARVTVIPLGVDSPALVASIPPDARQARHQLGLPTHGTWVGILGRIDPGKGQHVLIEAFCQLAPAYPDLHVLIQGDTSLEGGNASYATALVQRVSAQGLQDRVIFRPASPAVATAFRALDLFAMCSPGETYGVVTVEAMACGTPIVAAAAGSNPDLLAGGERGLLFAPNDPTALAAAIRTVLADPEAARQRATAAQAAAFGPLSKDAMLQGMDDLFRSLLP